MKVKTFPYFRRSMVSTLVPDTGVDQITHILSTIIEELHGILAIGNGATDDGKVMEHKRRLVAETIDEKLRYDIDENAQTD